MSHDKKHDTMQKNRFSGLFLLFFLSFLAPSLTAQPDCTISSQQLFPLCKGTGVTLTAVQQPNCVYEWSFNSLTTTIITFDAVETINVTLRVRDTITLEECLSTPFEVSVHPEVNIAFEQMQLTCTNGDSDNGNTAMVKAVATGQSGPYTYNWDVRPIQIAPGNPSLAIGLKAHLWYFINVVDQNGCTTKDSIFTKAYPNPVIEIKSTPDTAFIQNPYVTFEFTNKSIDTVQVTSHYWEMGDNTPRVDLEKPVHVYTEVDDYSVILTVFNQYGCDTVYLKDVKVLPIKLSIPNVITPNGDNINDVLIITEGSTEDETDNPMKSVNSDGGIRPLSAYYKKTTLVIFNRQGKKLYESSNYNNDWGGEGLSDGVYFYVLQCEGYKSNEVYKGSITIFGSGN